MSTLLDRMITILDKEGIKPRQLTDEFGVSNSSFSDWKKGKGNPSLAFVSRFAERFNVSLDYLVFGDELHFVKLENSNQQDEVLVRKFHMLTPDYQNKLLGYIDGILATMPTEE